MPEPALDSETVDTLSSDTLSGDTLSGMSFEDALAALEQVVIRLESGTVPLEESISLYTRGMALRAYCDERLKTAAMKIEQLTLSPEGVPVGAVPYGREDEKDFPDTPAF